MNLTLVSRLLRSLNCIVGVPQLFLRRSAELDLTPSLGEKIHRVVEKKIPGVFAAVSFPPLRAIAARVTYPCIDEGFARSSVHAELIRDLVFLLGADGGCPGLSDRERGGMIERCWQSERFLGVERRGSTYLTLDSSDEDLGRLTVTVTIKKTVGVVVDSAQGDTVAPMLT